MEQIFRAKVSFVATQLLQNNYTQQALNNLQGMDS